MLFILPDVVHCGVCRSLTVRSRKVTCNTETMKIRAKVDVCTFVRLSICNNFVYVIAHLSGAPVQQNVAADWMCLEAPYQVVCDSSQYWMGTNNVQNMVMNSST
jgi:hypothetical protein